MIPSGLCLITLMLLFFKCMGAIAIPWFWVFAPIMIPFFALCIMIFVVLVIAILTAIFE